MSGYFTESNYENAVLQLLNEDLGYTYVLPIMRMRSAEHWAQNEVRK